MSNNFKVIIEVCVDSVESAIAAVQGGADRLELCGNLGVGGGATPSTGLLKAVQKAVSGTPIMAMVRPRVGDFLYSPAEIDVMLEEITVFKELGVLGVVFGALTCGGRIDTLITSRLVAAARPMEVCFHRAFDMTGSFEAAFADLRSMKGITRILTSGHSASFIDAMSERRGVFSNLCGLNSLGAPVVIMPGSGLNPSTVTNLHFLEYLMNIRASGLKSAEIHLTGGHWTSGEMSHRPKDMGMGISGHEWDVWKTSEQAIREVRTQLNKIFPP